ncbi:MAG: ribosome silencing factor [Eubacteriales bacterium]|nr:ribosome silencing factor [Eubacteriales bacterium]
MVQTERIKNEICAALDNKKARNILIIDVKEMTTVTDYMITATGTTKTQLKSMCDEVEEKVAEKLDQRPLRIEGYTEGRWIVIDYGSVLVHIFCDEYRALYQLEQLWSNGDNVTKFEAEKDEEKL